MRMRLKLTKDAVFVIFTTLGIILFWIAVFCFLTDAPKAGVVLGALSLLEMIAIVRMIDPRN